tara:strand:+ start:1714 stop:2367 length:654 start_codon:yes stop_codon:yes gene_type:complete
MPFIGVQPASALLTSADIQDGQITTAKVADDAITGAKIENSPTIANGLTLTDGDITLASGHGINFSATSDGTTMSSELLDDYEEGSFTPVVADNASGGNTASGTFQGQYIKVGKQVQIYCTLLNINTSGMTSSNSIHVRGLPFTADLLSSSYLYGTGVVETDRITFENYVTAKIQNGNALFTLRDNDVNVADSSIKISDVNASGGSDISITLSYPSA